VSAEYITLPAAAKISGLGFYRLLQLCRSRELPARLDGNGRWFVERAALNAYRWQAKQQQQREQEVA
jgi:hypothetical protein